mmetsp:Transcript_77067/g.160393  ORF Transcript_77067/g.160393 Transcript_77067/m.160393 type:complete len:613 (+) Transcript_77067:193-2031(+)
MGFGGGKGSSQGGGGGSWGGKGGSSGGNWGARRSPPKFIPHRGGGDWGKRMRQEQQKFLKDEKTQRESDYFWQMQTQYGRKGAPGKGGGKFEERELFSATLHNVGIDFDKYESIDVEVSGRDAKSIAAIGSFEELWDRFELPDFLWYNVERCGYKKPTPVQRYSIPVALSGRDAMCCAQTGSGKTCAFLLPILSSIDEQEATGALGVEVGAPAAPKAIVLAPTRELCSQIHLEARKLTFQSLVRASEVYGGVEARPQLQELARGSDIVTATPGRLIDFIDREVMTMSAVGFLVLDEADRMLDMGFMPQIVEIVQKRDMPSSAEGRMTLMFSATFPKEIQRLAQSFMRNYVWIGVGRVGAATESVEQAFLVTTNSAKPSQLEKVLNENPNDTTLIFVAMKRTAAWLEHHLRSHGYKAVAIHGDMEQRERELSLHKFRSGESTFLVATDVAARGLDIPKVSHVINYDLPGNIEDYVHRIGRTGRIGNRGWATSFFVGAADARHSNTNILKDIISMMHDAGTEVPEDLQLEANRAGVGARKSSSRKGGGKSFGGRDFRGGDWGHHSAAGGFRDRFHGGQTAVVGGRSKGFGKAAWSSGGTREWCADLSLFSVFDQ